MRLTAAAAAARLLTTAPADRQPVWADNADPSIRAFSFRPARTVFGRWTVRLIAWSIAAGDRATHDYDAWRSAFETRLPRRVPLARALAATWMVPPHPAGSLAVRRLGLFGGPSVRVPLAEPPSPMGSAPARRGGEDARDDLGSGRESRMNGSCPSICHHGSVNSMPSRRSRRGSVVRAGQT